GQFAAEALCVVFFSTRRRHTIGLSDLSSDVCSSDLDLMPLLDTLRNEIGLNNPHFGCGLAQCGACTVHLDGQAIRSCVTPVSAAIGSASCREGGTTSGAATSVGPISSGLAADLLTGY